MATRDFDIMNNVKMNEKVYYNIENLGSSTEYVYNFTDKKGNLLSLSYNDDNKYPFNVFSHSSLNNEYEVIVNPIYSLDNDIKNVTIIAMNKNTENEVLKAEKCYNDSIKTIEWIKRVLESVDIKVKL